MAPARRWYCPSCHAVMGTLTTRHDQHGRRYTRLRLNHNVEGVGRSLFRGRYAECVCGERVRLPDDATVEFR